MGQECLSYLVGVQIRGLGLGKRATGFWECESRSGRGERERDQEEVSTSVSSLSRYMLSLPPSFPPSLSIPGRDLRGGNDEGREGVGDVG